MFPDNSADYCHILSVLELSWEAKREYVPARNYHALSFRIEGDVVFEHDGQIYTASTGELAYVPKGADYVADAKAHERLYVVHFDMPSDAPGEFATYRLTNAAYYEEVLRKMHRIWQRKQTGYRFAAASLFYTILEQMTKENARRENQSGKDKLSDVLEYIHRHYADASMSVATLSELYGSSPTYFRRIFKQTYGILPLQYIHDLRLKRAEELLKSGYYTVAEAAYATGFSDPKYFSRFMKKEKGIAPSKIGGDATYEKK